MTQLIAENVAEPVQREARSSYVFVAGTLVYYMGIWLQTWLTARLAGPRNLGLFGLALAIAQSGFAFANLNLRAVQLTDARHEFSFAAYMRARVWLGLAAVLAGISIARITGGFQVALVAAALCLVRMSDGMSEACQAALLQSGRPGLASQCLILRGLLPASALGLMLLKQSNLAIAVGAMAAVSWSLFFFHDCLLAMPAIVAAPMTSSNSRTLFMRALPAGAAAGLAAIGATIPVIALRQLRGDAALGILYPLIHLQSAGVVAITALCQSVSSELARSYLEARLATFFRIVKGLLSRAALLGGIACTSAIFVGPWLIQRVYGPGYRLSLPVIAIFTAAAAISFVGSALGCVVTATREFTKLWLPYTLIPLVAIVASAALIPALSSIGAPAAFFVVSIATCIAPLLAAARDRRFREYFA